jgi:hypothetical protein
MDRQQSIEDAGHQVITIWEHEYRQLVTTDKALAKFVEANPVLEAMNPRDGYFGGRTEVFQMNAKSEGDVKIYYYDVVSLYPSVMLMHDYPIGIPNAEISSFRFNSPALLEFWRTGTVFGMVSCKVIPPRGLWLPLLPVRSKKEGKLMFSLCATCLDNPLPHLENQRCEHNDEERAFTGTWVSVELYRAEQLGYKIVEISDMYHYDKSGPIFADFQKTWVVKKFEASGWPKHCKTQELKDEFRTKLAAQGIIVRPEEMDKPKNEAMRTISKLTVNSFYGMYNKATRHILTLYILFR